METQPNARVADIDASSLQKIARSDQHGLRELFDKYYTMLLAVAYSLLGDSMKAEDAVQTVFIRLWEKREEIHVQSSVMGYLKRMTINEALDKRRKFKRRLELSESIEIVDREDVTGEDLRIAGEAGEAAGRAIAALPDKCREVFELSRFQNLTYQEIADTLEISRKTVENHMGKALKLLRVALKEYISMFF